MKERGGGDGGRRERKGKGETQLYLEKHSVTVRILVWEAISQC